MREEGQTLCRVCNELKPQAEFYPHNIRVTKDVGECKACTRERVRKAREASIDYYRAYDRKRNREGRAHSTAHLPSKKAARGKVAHALAYGSVAREACYFCDKTDGLHAHHEDYAHPLDVVWLCSTCHGKLHAIRGDFRGSKGRGAKRIGPADTDSSESKKREVRG
jgi:hypothetical protein